MLCEWLLEMSRIGYGRTTEELKLVVKRILDKDGRPNPFCDNTPGYDWFTAFMKRLSIRQSESLPVSRAKGCSKEELDRWFSDFYDSFGRARTAEQARVQHGIPMRVGFPSCTRQGRTSGTIIVKCCKKFHGLTLQFSGLKFYWIRSSPDYNSGTIQS